MPGGKFCDPASLLLLSFRSAWRKGFPKDEIGPSSLRISSLAWGEKTVVKKKRSYVIPVCERHRVVWRGGKGGLSIEMAAKKKVENRHPGYRN